MHKAPYVQVGTAIRHNRTLAETDIAKLEIAAGALALGQCGAGAGPSTLWVAWSTVQRAHFGVGAVAADTFLVGVKMGERKKDGDSEPEEHTHGA